MTEPIKLPSYDTLDELVDTDPIRLRDAAFAMRSEVVRLTEELKRATDVVNAVRQVTGGGYLPPAWSYKWRERAEGAEAEVGRLNEAIKRAFDAAATHGAEAAMEFLSHYMTGVGGLSVGLHESAVQSHPVGGA